jgi:hypothetical protein
MKSKHKFELFLATSLEGISPVILNVIKNIDGELVDEHVNPDSRILIVKVREGKASADITLEVKIVNTYVQLSFVDAFTNDVNYEIDDCLLKLKNGIIEETESITVNLSKKQKTKREINRRAPVEPFAVAALLFSIASIFCYGIIFLIITYVFVIVSGVNFRNKPDYEGKWMKNFAAVIVLVCYILINYYFEVTSVLEWFGLSTNTYKSVAQ